MEILEENKSIFDIDVDCIVNPVNSVGVMGAGLAKQFMLKYPVVCKNFNETCIEIQRAYFGQYNKILIRPYFYRKSSWKIDKSILMFPTKIIPQNDSKIEYIEKSIIDTVKIINHASIKSIAFPKVGCGLGGLQWVDVKPIIEDTLSTNCKQLEKLIWCAPK